VPGSLVDYLVDDGAEVEAGDEVAVVSAMKMETRVEAPVAGTFRRVAAVGDAVAVGEAIARVE
jgi:acetyl-CoA/propionyl-CoA carboxylase biotin carboxyl carrier protein